MSCCCSPCRTGSSFSRSPGLFGSSFPRASDCAAALCEIWRRRVVALFLDKSLLNHDFARKLLGWEHSGFYREWNPHLGPAHARGPLPIRMIAAGAARPGHSSGTPHIVGAPLSLQRIRWDERQDTVTWSSSPSGFFKGKTRRYSSLDFIAQLTLPHTTPRSPPPAPLPVVLRPRSRNLEGPSPGRATAPPDPPLARRKAWAKLLAKVHELDVMACPQRHGRGPPRRG